MPDGQGQVSNFSLEFGRPHRSTARTFFGVVRQFLRRRDPDFHGRWQRSARVLRGELDGGGYGTYRIDGNARGSERHAWLQCGFFAILYRRLSRPRPCRARERQRESRPSLRRRPQAHAAAEHRRVAERRRSARPDARAVRHRSAAAATGRRWHSIRARPCIRPRAARSTNRRSTPTRPSARSAITASAMCSNSSRFPCPTQARPTSPGGVIDLDGDFGGSDVRWTYHGALGGRPFEFTAGVSYDSQNQHRLGYNNYVGSDARRARRIAPRRTRRRIRLRPVHAGQLGFRRALVLNVGRAPQPGAFHVRPTTTSPRPTATTAAAPRIRRRRRSPVCCSGASDRWHLYASYGNGFRNADVQRTGLSARRHRRHQFQPGPGAQQQWRDRIEVADRQR